MSKAIYPSKYTSNKITAHQYLADEICERIAKKAGKTLPYKYWYSNEWAKIYKRQVTAAGQLLQEVDCLTVMNFLRSKAGQKITSLGLKKQIFEGCKSPVNTKANIGCEQNLDNLVIYDEVEEIPTEEILSEPQASLWEKLQ